MEVYKTIKKSVSTKATGILNSRFSNQNSYITEISSEQIHSWIHPTDSLIKGHVEYNVRLLGKVEVNASKGTDVVQDAIAKLRYQSTIERQNDPKNSGIKLKKVVLQIDIHGVNVLERDSRKIDHKHTINRISYCAEDKQDKRLLSIIAKNDLNKYECFVFLSNKMAEKIALTISQAFDLAYERYLRKKGQALDQMQIIVLRKRVAELEEQNKLMEAKLNRCRCCYKENGKECDKNLLVQISPVSNFPMGSGINTGNNNAQSASSFIPPSHPPLPLAPPPRRASAEKNDVNKILAEVFEQHQNLGSLQKTMNRLDSEDLFDDEFDPRADEKKMNTVTGKKNDASAKQNGSTRVDKTPEPNAQDFDALLQRLDLPMAEITNEGWELERGYTGEAGKDILAYKGWLEQHTEEDGEEEENLEKEVTNGGGREEKQQMRDSNAPGSSGVA